MSEPQRAAGDQSLPVLVQPDVSNPSERPTLLLDTVNMALFTRVLIGLTLEGSDFLLERLQVLQQILDEDRQSVEVPVAGTENRIDMTRYLAIGLLLRGERRAIQTTRHGIEWAASTMGWLLGTADSVTRNPLIRPFRRPFDQLVDQLVLEGQLSLAEGRVAERDGRVLAREIVTEITDEVIDYISDNPKLADLVRDQIGAQGSTLTNVVVENARSVTVTGDTLLERLARRILGRTPRGELQPSPFAGQPQTMYTPEARASETAASKGTVG